MQSCDDELMQKIKKGDMHAFGILAGKWKCRLFNFAYKVVGDYELAEDVCQEVLLRVYQKAEQYRPREQFKTWLYRIAINCSVDELRKWKRRRVLPLGIFHQHRDEEERILEGALIDPAPQPDEEVQLNEITKCVQDALRRLPDKQRVVIVLRHYEGLKFQEIASALGCPSSTVKSQMSRGLKRLQTMLKHLLYEGGTSDEL